MSARRALWELTVEKSTKAPLFNRRNETEVSKTPVRGFCMLKKIRSVDFLNIALAILVFERVLKPNKSERERESERERIRAVNTQISQGRKCTSAHTKWHALTGARESRSQLKTAGMLRDHPLLGKQNGH